VALIISDVPDTWALEMYASTSFDTVLSAVATPTTSEPENSPNEMPTATAWPLAVIDEVSIACRLIAPPSVTPEPVVLAT
jgi:hypothetical protein